MYKILNIGGQDYKLEYTMEAALFGECAEVTTKIIEQFAEINASIDTNTTAKNALKEAKEKLEAYIKTISNVPQKVLTLFYAGLLEHHGSHPEGDGLVPNLQAAKVLLFKYMKEHNGEDEGDFFGVFNMILGQMEEDGFFDLTGLNRMLNAQTKKPKQPQDHKKKTVKVLEN